MHYDAWMLTSKGQKISLNDDEDPFSLEEVEGILEWLESEGVVAWQQQRTIH